MPRTTDSDGTPVPQRLLAAATRLFAEQGYDRTSVQEIVEAAGVTKGALYHYFGSKDDLLHEVYARVLRIQQERLDAVAGADEPVEKRLRAAAADVVVTTIDNLDDEQATRIGLAVLKASHAAAPVRMESSFACNAGRWSTAVSRIVQ